MIPAVLDCGVLVSAIGWGGHPRACLQLAASGQVRLCVTPDVWAEYDARVPAVLAAKRPGVDPRPVLDWLLTVAWFVDPAPLGKPRSRNPQDDPYLAAALSARAILVTYDQDLLDLGKPFGIEILRPSAFLKRFTA